MKRQVTPEEPLTWADAAAPPCPAPSSAARQPAALPRRDTGATPPSAPAGPVPVARSRFAVRRGAGTLRCAFCLGISDCSTSARDAGSRTGPWVRAPLGADMELCLFSRAGACGGHSSTPTGPTGGHGAARVTCRTRAALNCFSFSSFSLFVSLC